MQCMGSSQACSGCVVVNKSQRPRMAIRRGAPWCGSPPTQLAPSRAISREPDAPPSTHPYHASRQHAGSLSTKLGKVIIQTLKPPFDGRPAPTLTCPQSDKGHCPRHKFLLVRNRKNSRNSDDLMLQLCCRNPSPYSGLYHGRTLSSARGDGSRAKA